MDRRELLLTIGGVTLASMIMNSGETAEAQTPAMEPAIAGEPVAAFAAKAESFVPTLRESIQMPVALVRAVADASLVLRYRMEVEANAAVLATRSYRKGDSFIVDFGGHRTGYLAFDLQTEGREPDSPARLKLTFGEVPTDVAEPLYPYTGMLSSAWLPDEIINVDYLPQQVRMPRRYAFRYVKVEVLDTSPGFSVRFENLRAIAVSSAGDAPAQIQASALLTRIDAVAIATLRDCMQTCFEDGPRRDRRLWIGDLRLQALTNYATFKSNDVVKRCLYLFAAYPRQDGLVAACVFEQPKARYGGIHIVDYAAIFNVTLHDYMKATGDLATARDLWPVAKRQLEIVGRHIDAQGLYRDPGTMWIFIDWATTLDRSAAIQGLLLYAYKQTLELARLLGAEHEVADYAARITAMTSAARHAFWDPGKGCVFSGPTRQLSWASATWLVIGGALNAREGARALQCAMADPKAVTPVTPYLYSYTVEALLEVGMKAEARKLVESYWGGMVAAGADTFWEIYDPKQPLSSPYGDIHINSYCHAWSCTPSYFLRARGLAT